jgi:hypothetical protein
MSTHYNPAKSPGGSRICRLNPFIEYPNCRAHFITLCGCDRLRVSRPSRVWYLQDFPDVKNDRLGGGLDQTNTWTEDQKGLLQLDEGGGLGHGGLSCTDCRTVCVYVCVCARARVWTRVYVRACVYGCVCVCVLCAVCVCVCVCVWE